MTCDVDGSDLGLESAGVVTYGRVWLDSAGKACQARVGWQGMSG